MGFVPGPGGGNSSIAASTDVVLSGVQDDEVLAYEAATSKWMNKSALNNMQYLILQAGETVADLPSGTPEGTLVFRYSD